METSFLEIHKKFLISQNLLSEKDINEMEKAEKDSVDKALDFARKSPYPDPSQLYDDLYTDPINFA